jgi:hypothetical protein
LLSQDLVGFFTSIPTDRIIHSVQLMLMQYIELTGQPQQTFSVPVNHQQDKWARIFRGRRRTCSKTLRPVHLQDIVPLVTFSLDNSYFTCLQLVLSQTRGSCIGSPCSPALCSIVALVQESCWLKASSLCWHSLTSLGIPLLQRYVDNRLIIAHKSALQLPFFRVLLDLNFYQPPICLETVDDINFLGFNVHMEQLECEYIQPSMASPVRPYFTACSAQQKLTGFVTRLHLLCRGTWPPSNIPAAANKLIHHFSTQGYPPTVLTETARKVLVKYKQSL